MFRAVTGGATGGNLFNLNWAEFGGNGVTVQETSTPGGAGGTVPATLSLTLGTPAAFGAFTPGVARTYDACTTANVISTAGDATLSVADPSPIAHGPPRQRRVLAAAGRCRPRRRARRAPAARSPPVGGSANPTTLLTYAAPVSNDAVDDRVPAGDRRQRRAAHRQLLQDADVHAVDHDAVSLSGRRASARRPHRGARLAGRAPRAFRLTSSRGGYGASAACGERARRAPRGAR